MTNRRFWAQRVRGTVCSRGRVKTSLLPDAADLARYPDGAPATDSFMRNWTQNGHQPMRVGSGGHRTNWGGAPPTETIRGISARHALRFSTTFTENPGSSDFVQNYSARWIGADLDEVVPDVFVDGGWKFDPDNYSYLAVAAWRYHAGASAAVLYDVNASFAGKYLLQNSDTDATFTVRSKSEADTVMTRSGNTTTENQAIRAGLAFDTTLDTAYAWHNNGSLFEDSAAVTVNADEDYMIGFGFGGDVVGAVVFEFDGALPSDWKTAVDAMTTDWISGAKRLYQPWAA